MDIKEKIALANQQAVSCIVDSDPVWIDIQPAGECVEGLEDHMILHSGPPIDYDDMVMLHQRGMVSAMLFEGWAKDEKEAIAFAKDFNGTRDGLKVKISSKESLEDIFMKYYDGGQDND